MPSQNEEACGGGHQGNADELMGEGAGAAGGGHHNAGGFAWDIAHGDAAVLAGDVLVARTVLVQIACVIAAEVLFHRPIVVGISVCICCGQVFSRCRPAGILPDLQILHPGGGEGSFCRQNRFDAVHALLGSGVEV